MEDHYLSLSGPSHAHYKEKGSKFLAFAYPVTSEEEVKTQLDTLKKEYYDARHHCYAYRLGYPEAYYRAYDDGEPNHSAGDPILGQIRSLDLYDVLVVVVRYFGGTKLGMSGLIQAYKQAACAALQEGVTEEKILTDQLSLQFAYPQLDEVMRIVKAHELEILGQEMYLDCRMQVSVPQSKSGEVREKLKLISGLRLDEEKPQV